MRSQPYLHLGTIYYITWYRGHLWTLEDNIVEYAYFSQLHY